MGFITPLRGGSSVNLVPMVAGRLARRAAFAALLLVPLVAAACGPGGARY